MDIFLVYMGGRRWVIADISAGIEGQGIISIA